MDTHTITDRVQRGAALLDTKFPGWDEKVRLDRLNLSSGCDCILGQRFGDYFTGLFKVGLSHLPLKGLHGHPGWVDAVAARHGFLAENQTQREYAALTKAWKELIENRRIAREMETMTISAPEAVAV